MRQTIMSYSLTVSLCWTFKDDAAMQLLKQEPLDDYLPSATSVKQEHSEVKVKPEPPEPKINSNKQTQGTFLSNLERSHQRQALDGDDPRIHALCRIYRCVL